MGIVACKCWRTEVGVDIRNNCEYLNFTSGMSGVSVLRGGCTRGSRGVLVPSSRAGAARAAAILLISCHLSPSHGNRRGL